MPAVDFLKFVFPLSNTGFDLSLKRKSLSLLAPLPDFSLSPDPVYFHDIKLNFS